MRWAVWLAAAGIALVGAGTASAGCMATVGLSPQPDVAAGETWTASIQVLQHGQTPMADATPSVIIANAATGEERTFPATLSDPQDGVYVASVVFPTAGSWSVAVNDGFPVAECAQTHTFGAHTIAAAGPPPEPPRSAEPAAAATPASGAAANDEAGGSVALPLGLGLGLGLVAAVAATLAARARRNREAGLA
jgi:YtkA-like protein